MTASHRTQASPRRAVFRDVLRATVVPTLGAGLLASVVLGLVRGLGGGVSAAVGVAIAVAFFASGLAVMARFVVDTENPLLFMAVGMATYFAQIILLFGVILLAGEAPAFDSLAAGISILVCVVVWQVMQMVAWRRARVPVYDETPGGGAPAPTTADTTSAGPSGAEPRSPS